MDRAKNTNISDIIIVGDLNNDLLKPSKCKHLRELIANYELSQLIKEPTHFTEISLIDVIMTSNLNSIIASEICDPFIPNRIRYHCPVAVILSFPKYKSQNYKRQIWKYDAADYSKYRQILIESDLLGTVTNMHEDINTITQQINSIILSAAEQSIPNKIVTIRPPDQPWMHNEIRKKVQVGKDQEKAQSEKDSHSKNQDGKKTN